ncbi:MAG: hypothetical protein WBC92_07485 [Terracidiphilus sp.]
MKIFAAHASDFEAEDNLSQLQGQTERLGEFDYFDQLQPYIIQVFI